MRTYRMPVRQRGPPPGNQPVQFERDSDAVMRSKMPTKKRVEIPQKRVPRS